MNKVKDVFYDPKRGFVSFKKFKEKLREADIFLSDAKIKKFLEDQFVNQVMKPVEKAKEFNSIISHGPGHNWQLDFIIYDRYEWKGYKYVLVIIDVYSRYVWAFPMTNRENKNIMNVIDSVAREYGYPKNINLDNEFNTKEFSKWCEKHNIKAWFSDPNEINKNAIVERMNRTIINMIQKVRVATKRYDWPKYLPDLIENYNNTIHGTTKQKPIDVFHGKKYNEQIYRLVGNNFKVGDKVRIRIKKKVFSKGDSLSYSPEIYVINSIVGNRYDLKDVDSGKILGTKYKPYEIKKIDEIEFKEPEAIEENQEEEHKNKVKTKRLDKLNKLSGVDTSNIVEGKRIKKENTKYKN